jgi:thioredoxin reductase (NADPH)
VVLQFDLPIQIGERVLSIRKLPDGLFSVTTTRLERRREWTSRRVVLAIGDMHRPRMLDVPGEELPHVSHYFTDPHNYFRRRVLIVGGRNSAVEAAIRCVRVGASVTLAYRGPDLDSSHIKFWLFPEISGMIRDGRITFLRGTTLRSIGMESAVLDRGNGRSTELDIDAVLLLTGYEQDASLFEEAGVQLVGDNRRPLVDERTMETNVQGLYVAGTAVAGTQSSGVKEFIETSHVHVERIVAAITGAAAPLEPAEYDMPES